MDRLCSVLRKVCLSLVALLPAQGVAEVQVIATLPYGGVYAPDAWIPLKVEASNDGAAMIDGTIRIVPKSPVVPEFRAPLRVPPHSRAQTTLWVRLPVRADRQPESLTVALHDASGARVQISELLARPAVQSLSYKSNGVANAGCIISLMPSGTLVAESYIPEEVAAAIEAGMDFKAPIASIEPAYGAPVGLAYSSAYAVVLAGLDPRDLNPAQRQAMLDYVVGGGVLVLSSPDPRVVAGSWLEPYLPVRLVGTREMNALPLSGEDAVALDQWYPVTEAIAGEGTILWQDAELVHAAYRPLGLGRVVFTSFPSSALKGKDTRTQKFWREMLMIDRAPIGVNGSHVAAHYGRLMEPMLGRQAASWKLAIGAAGLVVLLTVGTQLVWRGAARPKAFAVSLGMSVLLAGAFTAMSLLRQESEPLQHAVLSIADVSPEGSTVQQYAALAGPPQKLAQVAVSATSGIYPVLLREERPVITHWPARVAPVTVSPEAVKQVTLSQGTLREMQARVTGQFMAEGLRLDVDNQTGAALGSAQLVWGTQRLSAGEYATGQGSRVLTGADLRPADEYAATSGMVSQDQLQKGEIVKSLLTAEETLANAPRTARSLLAFADQLPGLSRTDGAEVDTAKQQNLLRMPVEIVPSPAGSAVRADGCFTRIVTERAQDLPFYNQAAGQFLRTVNQGAWVFGIEAPREIGVLQLQRARVRIDLASPQYKIILKRGQSRGGKRTPNPAGAVLGEWDGAVGLQTVEFEPAAGDFDAQGRLWLRLEATQSGQAGSLGVDPHWRIMQLLVDLEGTVR